jgi:UMF1 family MFS transporter
MSDAAIALAALSEQEYRKRIRAWTMYDWANSAFATTVLAAVLPIYYSSVAGATLPSEVVATAYWSIGLSVSMFLIALLSPLLGTISDVMRSKKLFLALFAGMGILGTALLVLVGTGDWILASILTVLGFIGWNASLVFYDALLPHVAKPEDQDNVSAQGYAMGYLGGGLLLILNVAMILLLPGTWGPRLSFVSVAIWWGVFTVPLLRNVPEPPGARGDIAIGENIVLGSFRHLIKRIQDISRYKELFKYFIAFLIYNDGISTIIGVAAIYGKELRFGTLELILALLLVQFVGIPYSLIFGRIANPAEKRRSLYAAFIALNLIVLPLGGVLGKLYLPANITGVTLPPYQNAGKNVGQGMHGPEAFSLEGGTWTDETVPAASQKVGGAMGFMAGEFAQVIKDTPYKLSGDSGAQASFAFNGQDVKLIYSSGPDRGQWAVAIDGKPVMDGDTGKPLVLDAYNAAVHYGASETFKADTAGKHSLTISNTGNANSASTGSLISLAGAEVLSPRRQNNLGLILGAVLGVEVLCAALAFLTQGVFKPFVERIDTKRAIILGLVFYMVIAFLGFILDSTIEFWFLAWMVAVVQGGSQALSRSLYASMSPSAKSGEFFGLFGVMDKFSSLIGPLVFAATGLYFGSSRPAVLSLIAFFVIGIWLLMSVDVEAGKRVAQEEDLASQSKK